MFTIYNDTAKPRPIKIEDNRKSALSKRLKKVDIKRVRHYWEDFCNSTSVHGVRYLVAYDRPLFERCLWAIILAVSMYFAVLYTAGLYSRWRSSPIEPISVITYESTENIPFPAVTICNNMKATPETRSDDALVFLCGLEDDEEPNDTYIDVETIIKMAPPFNRVCNFLHDDNETIKTRDCTQMFTRTITQNGVCYTFNMFDPKEVFREGVINNFCSHNRTSDWNPETGYIKGATFPDNQDSDNHFLIGPYPKRAIMQSYTKILAKVPLNGSYCYNDNAGIKLGVHSPLEAPPIGHRHESWILVNNQDQNKETSFTNFNSDSEYILEIEAEETRTSRSLKIFQPHQRNCYFNGERELSLFKFYTQTNCENECLINSTVTNCACVDFYMPHFKSTNICPSMELECITDTLDWWERRGKKACNCYPPCTDLKYNVFMWARNITSKTSRNGTFDMSIYMYFLEEVYTSKERKQSQWTIVDFIGSCGGVFGLFCGLSLIGVLEFIYFATIRYISNCWRHYRSAHSQRVSSDWHN